MAKILKLLVTLIQIFLIGVHLLLYACFVFFFPQISTYKWVIIPILLFLALSIIGTSVLIFKYNNPFNRIVYLISVIWAAMLLYLGVASALSLLIFLVGNTFGITAPYSGIAAVIYTAAVLVTIYGAINAKVIRQIEVDLRLEKLPEHWRGKSAVVLSDLHLGHIQGPNFAKKIVDLISSLGADIVLIPGDFFDGGRADFPKLAAPFKELKPKHGIYFVSGNHDKYPNDPRTLEHIRNAGIRVIDEQLAEADGLQIVGIGYHSSESEHSFKEKLQGLKIDPKKPTVLLKHVPTPEHIAIAAEAGVDLQLSGHTHHGQTYPFRYITRKIFGGFDYGLKKLRDLWVYTTSGIGTWGPPVRVATKSEIVKINFK